MMMRRDFITLLGGAATWPLAAGAQQGERMRRIGVLMPQTADDQEAQTRVGAFVQALSQLGWTIGHNVRIDYRWGTTYLDRGRRYAEMSAVAVCCCSDSVSSRARACTSSNSRTFSIAIAAWSAKVLTSSICLSVKGCTVRRISKTTPRGIPSRRSGTLSIVR